MREPKSWCDITISEYLEIRSLKPDDFESVFEYRAEKMAIILKTDVEEIEEMDMVELFDLEAKTSWVNGIVLEKIQHCFYEKGMGILFEAKPWKKLTLGEFIDLEALFASGYYENSARIMAVVYRKVLKDKWGHKEFEPYGFNKELRALFFMDMPVSNFEAIKNSYLKFRDDFLGKRKSLFKNQDTEEEEGDSDIEEQDIEEEKKELVVKKWSWQLFVFNICRGDLTKVDAVTDLPLTMVFNFEAMKKELNINN